MLHPVNVLPKPVKAPHRLAFQGGASGVGKGSSLRTENDASQLTGTVHRFPVSPGMAQALKSYARPQVQSPRFGMTPVEFFQGDIFLGNHPSGDPDLDKWDDIRKKSWDVATRPREGFPEGWLQPLDTTFVVKNLEELMQVAARSGFASRYPHWSFGQNFNELYQPQKHGLSKLYELVVNTDPSVAYLLDTNPTYSQKVVMCHVYGHTDFFKNNYTFSQTNRKIMDLMGDTKRFVENLRQDPLIMRKSTKESDPIERFLDDYQSVEFLIDLDKLSPPPLNLESGFGNQGPAKQAKRPEVGPNMQELKLSPLFEDFLLTEKERQTEIDRQLARQEYKERHIPPRPTQDVLGFIAEHSQALGPWQRELLVRLREESYYFAPQLRTKIMNEGWASFWHTKLMQQPELVDKDNHDEAFFAAEMMAGVEAPSRTSLNPYALGFKIFDTLYKNAGRGIPIDATDEELQKLYTTEQLEEMKKAPIDEVKGVKAIQEVRKWEDDISFMEKYLTPQVAKELNLYLFDETEDWWQGKQKIITTKDFEKIKSRIINQYRNAGMPAIEVVDGNYGGNGQLRLRHLHYDQDLNRADARKTIRVLYRMWGQPIHLDTKFTIPDEVFEQLKHKIALIKQYQQYGSQPWWGPRPKVTNEDIKKMEEELQKLQNNNKIPIRITTTDGQNTEIWELNDKDEPIRKFNPNQYHVELDNPWDY